MLDKIKGVILGHAVGDALGVPVEFCTRDELEVKPVCDMEGHGTHDVPAGTWSDDTSMSLAALDSLIKGLDYNEIMDNFASWLGDSKFTADGEVFDVGNSSRKSILLYAAEDITPLECGLTHSHERSIVGCGIYAFIVWELLREPTKISVYKGLSLAGQYFADSAELEHYSRLFELDFANISADEINSSGYIVDTLEAAVWCLLNSGDYSECVLKAVNLGEDTDTVAAVAGGMAGALWGYSAIPSKWLNKLARRDYIEELCIKACRKWY